MSNVININKGNTYRIPVNVTDSDGGVYDLTDYEMYLTIKTKVGGTCLLQKEAVIETPASGQGVVVLSNEDTEITAGEYAYDVTIIKDDGGIVEKNTVIIDKLNVTEVIYTGVCPEVLST
jgi:hypothetical protein